MSQRFQLRVHFGDRFAKLDKTAVQAVVTAQLEGSVTNSRMQESLVNTPKTVPACCKAWCVMAC